MLSVIGRSVKRPFGNKLKSVVNTGKDEIYLQLRCAHDVQVPDFDNVRKKTKLDPAQYSKTAGDGDKLFEYGVGAAAYGLALTSAKSIVRGLVSYIGPTAASLSEARVEINVQEISLGQSLTFMWKGKPVFIRHRTEKQIAIEDAVDITTLRDPQTDDERVRQKEFLVVIGVCTHLGCVPLHSQGSFGGYFCPCHGSHYDFSGRIRKGPAPLNLEVPPHSFNGDILTIG